MQKFRGCNLESLCHFLTTKVFEDAFTTLPTTKDNFINAGRTKRKGERQTNKNLAHSNSKKTPEERKGKKEVRNDGMRVLLGKYVKKIIKLKIWPHKGRKTISKFKIKAT